MSRSRSLPQIKNGEFSHAIAVLAFQRENYPRSRAAMSLLAYCYYHNGDMDAAADWCGLLPRSAVPCECRCV